MIPPRNRNFEILAEFGEYSVLWDAARNEPGVFVANHGIERLANALRAAESRLNSWPAEGVPDAIADLRSQLSELLIRYRSILSENPHRDPRSQQQEKDALREVEEALRKLRDPDDDGPRRA